MLAAIRRAFFDGNYLVTRHFLDSLLDRGIAMDAVAGAVRDDEPEIIEDYPADAQGASCLILCKDRTGTCYHVVCSHPPAVWLITVYEPDPARWTQDFRQRVRP